MKQHSKAFTLVELAIVITIIGLLIGGVLKGQELLENARMTSLGNQLNGYRAAVTTFMDIYKSMPGDTANATNFITGCTAANNCANGNGDSIVASQTSYEAYWYAGFDTAEAFQTWKHMALANLITGVDTTVAKPTVYQAGVHVPASPVGGMIYMKTATGAIHASVNAGRLTAMITPGTNGFWIGGNMTAAKAQKIDMKLDDGIALTGVIYAVSTGFNTGCGVIGGANGTTGYGVNAAGTPCEIGSQILQ